MTLAEFVLARIAEDEGVCRMIARESVGFIDADPPDWYTGHLAGTRRGHPHVVMDVSRALAECEAKRRIVAMHKPGAELCYWSHDSSAVHDNAPCLTLRVLALPYADHPDYDEEWRP